MPPTLWQLPPLELCTFLLIFDCSPLPHLFQAVSSLNVAVDTIQKIEEVVDFVNNQLMVDDSGMSVQASQLSGSLSRQNQLSSCSLNVAASEQAHDSRSNGAVAPHEAHIPSELIANCVATLLMIQVSLKSCFSIGFIWPYNVMYFH